MITFVLCRQVPCTLFPVERNTLFESTTTPFHIRHAKPRHTTATSVASPIESFRDAKVACRRLRVATLSSTPVFSTFPTKAFHVFSWKLLFEVCLAFPPNFFLLLLMLSSFPPVFSPSLSTLEVEVCNCIVPHRCAAHLWWLCCKP